MSAWSHERDLFLWLDLSLSRWSSLLAWGLAEELEVLWYFDADDEDMLEAGEDYDHIVGVPFKFVEVDPEA